MDTSRIKRHIREDSGHFNSNSSRENSSDAVKYGIAAVIIGSVIANMFIGKRMRSYKHVKSPINSTRTGAEPFDTSGAGSSANKQRINQKHYRTDEAFKSPFPSKNDLANEQTMKRLEKEQQFVREYIQWAQAGYPTDDMRQGTKKKKIRPSFTFDLNTSHHSSISNGTGWASWLLVLDLPSDVVPTKPEIKAAFRIKAAKHHPDQGGTGDSAAFASAVDAQKALLRKVTALEKHVGLD